MSLPLSLPRPPILVISDRRQARWPLDQVAAAVFAAGGRWFLLRDKDLAPAARRRMLERLVAVARPYGATILLGGDPALARAAGAAGVHLPDGGDVAAARAVLGAAALIGFSAHDLAGAAAAARAGADYVIFSPIFPSASKPGYGPALGLTGLRDAAARLPVPVLALGGVTAATMAGCLDAGAAGVAVMGAVMSAEDPGAAMAALRAKAVAPAGQSL